MPQRNVSSQQFIGRDREITIFRKLLTAADSDKRILNLFGGGGIGKTWLLEEFRRILGSEYPDVLVNHDFVDFYFTANQHEFGVLRNIASQLDPGSSCFDPFTQAISQYERHMEGYSPLTPEVQRNLRKHVYDRFIDGLQALSEQRRVVLLFDTAEEAGQAIVDLAQAVLTKLGGNTLVVIAGRQKIDLGGLQKIEHIELKGFTPKVAVQYFRGLGFEADDLSDKDIRRLHRLSSNGQPILMALTVGLLERYSVERFLALPPKKFTAWLVERVTDLGQFENQVILYMATVWRRFDSAILEYLSGESVELCQETIRSLSGQLFVKYRPGQMGQPESCILHDKMRDLVNDHLWPRVDRDGTLRRELSGKMVDYYENALANSQLQMEQQVLGCEQLYYRMDHDLDDGFVASRKLWDAKAYNRNDGYCAAINAEIERFFDRLPVEYQHEHQYRHGWVVMLRGEHQDAIKLWEEIQVDKAVSKHLRAMSLANLVERYADNSEFNEAEERGVGAIELYRNLIQEAATDRDRTLLEQEQGVLFNNLGFMYRKQEHWQEAIDYYNRAMDCGGPPWYIARVRNNLGFTHNLLGRSELAFSHCQAALRIRERLGIPYELGLSYNTLGILCVDNLRIPEADAFFQKAIVVFAQARSTRGRALVYTALGRLYRQWGWYEEHVVGQGFDRERKRYKDAINYLEEAVDIYGQLQDETGQAEALGELGCTFRERREWSQAIITLTKAVVFAQTKGLRRREADILQDLSMTYWRAYLWSGRNKDNLRKAEDYAQQAVDRIKAAEAEASRAGTDTVAAGFPYLLSKAQWALGDIAFERQGFDEAFLQYAQACVNVTKLDPQAISHDSAKKKLHYEDLVKHVVDKILGLPHQQKVTSASEALLTTWKNAGLSEEFPGFIENIEAACKDYELLRGGNEGASNA